MSKLFLHVGMPKTGTSFIQGFVNVNQKLITEIAQLDFISDRTPHEIACHLISDNALIERADIKELRTADFRGNKEELQKIKEGGLNCFCSSEYFILSDKNDVIEFFSNYFDEIEIIYAVRRQDKLLASGFNQSVKALNLKSNLVWSYRNAKTIRYFQNCKAWEKLGCKVNVIDYDSVKKDSNGLNRAIFSLFLDTDLLYSGSLREPAKNASNFSLSENELLIKLCLNRLNLKNDKLVQEFGLFEQEKREFVLPPAYAELIASCYYDDNQAIVSQYMVSGSGNDLAFQDMKLDRDINIQEAQFNWDPLARNRTLVEFLVKRSSELKEM